MSRRVRLRIRYDRRSGLVVLLTLALLTAVFPNYLAWGQREAAASGSQIPLDHARGRPLASSASLRGYYLTQSTYNGAQADGTDGNGAGVCADGYHFASLWEILDPSNLKYNTDLGYTLADSGQGPPSFFGGWVRTGYTSSTDNTAGVGNCNAWTSSDSGHRGTWAHLPDDWTAGGEDMHVWEVYTGLCHQSGYVWCVADKVSTPVYLPIILKNSS
jgi:hypothetical protein